MHCLYCAARPYQVLGSHGPALRNKSLAVLYSEFGYGKESPCRFSKEKSYFILATLFAETR